MPIESALPLVAIALGVIVGAVGLYLLVGWRLTLRREFCPACELQALRCVQFLRATVIIDGERAPAAILYFGVRVLALDSRNKQAEAMRRLRKKIGTITLLIEGNGCMKMDETNFSMMCGLFSASLACGIMHVVAGWSWLLCVTVVIPIVALPAMLGVYFLIDRLGRDKSSLELSDRCRKLAESNYGCDYGWYVEYQGQIVGSLDDWQWVEMFWDSYRVTAESELTADIIYDDSGWGPWGQAKFRYRNKQLNEYAQYAFCGGGELFINDGRILMRGLYLLPGSEAEDKAVAKEIARRKRITKT